MVALLGWLIWGGWALEGLGFGAAAAQAYGQHKAVGMIALGLAMVRLALRLALPGPGHAPNWRGRASLGVQRALYGLMLLYPISGYAFHSATQGVKVPLGLWGWKIPDVVMGGAAFWQSIHHLCLPALGFVLSLHLAGALFHLSQRDGMIRRILPF